MEERKGQGELQTGSDTSADSQQTECSLGAPLLIEQQACIQKTKSSSVSARVYGKQVNRQIWESKGGRDKWSPKSL